MRKAQYMTILVFNEEYLDWNCDKQGHESTLTKGVGGWLGRRGPTPLEGLSGLFRLCFLRIGRLDLNLRSFI